MQLVFATNNAHKLSEIQAFLGQDFFLKTLQEAGCYEELPENGETLEANSLEKTAFLAQKYGFDCFGDDSGLEVTALGGEPGVHSAYYAGSRDATQNMNKLLVNLGENADRSARFRSVITLILKGQVHQFEGIVEGTILTIPRGEQGFGYDPLFVPDGNTRTFAEMSLTEKNQQNHRIRALEKMLAFLREANQ